LPAFAGVCVVARVDLDDHDSRVSPPDIADPDLDIWRETITVRW